MGPDGEGPPSHISPRVPLTEGTGRSLQRQSTPGLRKAALLPLGHRMIHQQSPRYKRKMAWLASPLLTFFGFSPSLWPRLPAAHHSCLLPTNQLGWQK